MTAVSGRVGGEGQDGDGGMPQHGQRRDDGKQWCSGCGRWKFLAIHSCPGVWQPTKVLRADGTVERYS